MEKGHTIKVLDHGFVRLVDWMGDDVRIVEAARVSYESPSKGEEADRKLLDYLLSNKHTSPFEMVKLMIDVRMPIFVQRQYIRHRMQNLNEVSARYTQLPSDFYIPNKWRRQDVKNKQGSTDEGDWNPSIYLWQGQEQVILSATEAVRQHCDRSYALYEQLLQQGIAREMARIILPVNIYTHFYACWDLKNLLHFVALRDDSHAQAEIQEYGRAIKSILQELFPWTMDCYERIRAEIEEFKRWKAEQRKKDA